MDPIDPRDFGNLEGRFDALRDQVTRLDHKVDRGLSDVQQALRDMEQTIAQAKGGGKVMQWLMGGGAGAVVAWFAQQFGGTPK